MAFKSSEVCRRRRRRTEMEEEEEMEGEEELLTSISAGGAGGHTLSMRRRLRGRAAVRFLRNVTLTNSRNWGRRRRKLAPQVRAMGLTKKFSWHFGLFLYMNPLMNLYTDTWSRLSFCLSVCLFVTHFLIMTDDSRYLRAYRCAHNLLQCF